MVGIVTRSSIFVGVFLCAYAMLGTLSAHAALLYFDPAESTVFRGDTVTLGLRIDTDEGECINTVDAVIHYDPSIRAVDVSRGDSILNIWVENPVVNEAEHTITFAGGIPGGYCGRIPGDPRLTNVLLELVFRSPGLSIGTGDNPSPRIWIDESSQVLLHDGYGTNAELRLQDAKIILESKAGGTPTDAWTTEVQNDAELPSDFSITLTKDDVAFGGRYFIVFNSNDKQSGIDHYEVMEEPFEEFNAFKWGRADAPWLIAESPYVLKDQTLNSTIRVKAIDKAGNERIAVIVPDEALSSMSQNTRILIIIGGLIVGAVITLGIVVYMLYRKRRRTRQHNENYEI